MHSVVRLSVIALITSSCAPLPGEDIDSTAQEVVSASVATPNNSGGFQYVALNTSVGTQLACDSTQQMCAVRNVPLLSQWSDLIDPASWAGRAWGCYDTSMAIVRFTSLENRDFIGSPGGRTAVFDTLASATELRNGVSTFVPREYHHVSMQSWPQTVAAAATAQTPLPPRPSFLPNTINYTYFGLHEVIRDFGPIRQSCDATVYGACAIASNGRGVAFRDFMNNGTGDHVTNDYVRGRLRDGYNVILAFQRYTPAVTNPPRGGTPSYSFTFNNKPHKVVVSGFRSGLYPLRINDVGSGSVRFARLVNTPPTGVHAGVNIPVGASPLTLPNGRPRQASIEFEDNPTDVVQFIDHVDGLRLGAEAPSRALYSGTWAPGFSRLAPFESAGQSHMIRYNPATGAVAFDRFYPSGNGVLSLWNGTWAVGWSNVVAYPMGGQTNFFLYNAATGAVRFEQMRADLQQGHTLLGFSNWGAGFTTVEPFTVGGQRYVLLYNASTGAVRYMLIDPNGASAALVWSYTWGAGFTHFTPLTFEAEAHFVLYNGTTGAMQFDRVLPTLNGVMPHFEGTWSPGWSRQATVVTDALGSVTLYNPSTGAANVQRARADGGGMETAWTATWPTGATNLVPIHLGAQPVELLYNASTGAWTTYTVPAF